MPAAPDVTVVAQLPDGDVWQRITVLYDQVAEIVADAVRHGDRPLVTSGDCATALGTVAGMQRAGVDPAVVWFDAHGDVQTLETTASGYVGGMPLRVLAGYRPELIATPLGLGVVAEDRIVLVDARDLDPPEADYLRRSAIRVCDAENLASGVLPDGPLYLHLDVDVFDRGDLPGLRYPVAGGPAATTVAGAIERVLQTGRVAAVGLACTWYPGHSSARVVRKHLDGACQIWERES